MGDIKDWQEAISGVDLVTGERLAWWERGVTVVAGVVPVLPGKGVRELTDAKGLLGRVVFDERVARYRDLKTGKFVAAKAVKGVSLIERLKQVGVHSEEGKALIRELADLSTQGPRKGTVVLGRFRPDRGFMSYIEKAKAMKATSFNTPKSGSFSVWQALEEAGIDPWEVNRQFLDDAIARGDIFYVEADLGDIYKRIVTAGSFNEVREKPYLYREIYYLIREKGYRIQGSYLVK